MPWGRRHHDSVSEFTRRRKTELKSLLCLTMWYSLPCYCEPKGPISDAMEARLLTFASSRTMNHWTIYSFQLLFFFLFCFCSDLFETDRASLCSQAGFEPTMNPLLHLLKSCDYRCVQAWLSDIYFLYKLILWHPSEWQKWTRKIGIWFKAIPQEISDYILACCHWDSLLIRQCT